jgi:phosphoserine phosphatase
MRSPKLSRRRFLAASAGAGVGACGWASAQDQSGSSAQGPAKELLPSWNDGATRTAIVDFVRRVTDKRRPDYVSPPARIAVFDNDGTLWSEQPVYVQLQFALDRVKALAAQHPEWRDTQPFKAVLEGDRAALEAAGEKAVVDIVTATHAGMTPDEFGKIAAEWLAAARQPRFGRLHTEMAYRSMLELLAYLRHNGFRTFIVTGGGADFVRAYAGEAYGIAPEQVIGSSIAVRYETGADGKPVLIREPRVEHVDDGPGKPVGINRVIGQRPILAFGNSDGDLEMLQYAAAGSGPRFMGLVHHTDAEREWAYDRSSSVGRLDRALDEARRRGWTVVDMKLDWRDVFVPATATGTRALQ